MSDYRDDVLSELKIGSLTNLNETLNYTFSPQWVNWFKPNFSYNTNYSWNKPRNGVVDAANLNLVKNTGVNFSISPTEIIEIFYTPVSKRDNNSAPPRTRSRGLASFNPEEENKNEEEKSKKTNDKKTLKNNFALERIYNESKKIEPLTITISNITTQVSNGIDGDIPLSYRLGFKDNLNVESVPEVGLNTGNEDIKKSFSARTGVRFNPQSSLMISFNESISSNINGYNIDIRSTTRDYIAFGSYLSEGLPFSNWSLSCLLYTSPSPRD